jgi:CYTH domain-containing protein
MEIEYKFLLPSIPKESTLQGLAGEPCKIVQYYIHLPSALDCLDVKNLVKLNNEIKDLKSVSECRIRKSNDAYTLTLKGEPTGASRPEYEYSISEIVFSNILEASPPLGLIRKTRWKIPTILETELFWVEVDCFENPPNLCIAEVEVKNESKETYDTIYGIIQVLCKQFTIETFQDVTTNKAYKNKQLAVQADFFSSSSSSSSSSSLVKNG